MTGGSARRPAALGVVSLVLVGVSLCAVIVSPGFSASIDVTLDPSRTGWSVLPGLGVLLLVMATRFLGLVGSILGIVATVTNRGRGFGVVAIVLGAVSFLIAASSMIGMLFVVSG